MLLAGSVVSFAHAADDSHIPYGDQFAVQVSDGTAWRDVAVLSVPVDRVENGRHNTETSSVACFDMENPVTVRVIHRQGAIREARIRPSSLQVPFEQTDSVTLLLTIDKPANLSVEVNGDIYHNLQLFASAPFVEPKPQRGTHVIRFPAGYHRLERGRMDLPSHTLVVVELGAYVEGGFRIVGQHDVQVVGRGFVRPAGRGYGVEITSSHDILVEGIVTTQVPTGGSHDVTIRNVRSMTHYGWGDGLNVFASSNVLIDGCFARNSDDCHTVYATRMGHIGSSRNITVQNSILWADVAHPIFIGLHGAASYKKDVAGRHMRYAQNPDSVILRTDTIEHLVYRNLDILEQREAQVDYQGCLAIGCGDNNLVRDVLFEDIRVEPIHCGQLLFLRVFHNEKYCQAPGTAIRDVTFRRVTYAGGNDNLSLIEGWSAERPVSGVHFQDLTIAGRHICDTMPGKPSWYKTADFARIFIGNHVTDVTFE